MLLEKWETAEEIVKPILYHHMEGIPETFVFETAIVQFVNLVDCVARGIHAIAPSNELMSAAGIEEIDKDYWLSYQRNLIASLEKEQTPQPMKDTRMEDTDTKNLGKRAANPKQISTSSPVPQKTEEPKPVQPPLLSQRELEMLNTQTYNPSVATVQQKSVPMQQQAEVPAAQSEPLNGEQNTDKTSTQVIKRQSMALPSQQQNEGAAIQEGAKETQRQDAGAHPTQVMKRQSIAITSQQQGKPSPLSSFPPSQPEKP